ncbi:MAG: tRNA (adenosine(37)-N6)-threonylcarbamoyltransferase complex ATPase subunit type 1 TsaE [Bacteroidales bacterium]|nr:tRNA (adenosine(37)-N6)-threonylcarbamoyltransferase complex ATPase subunit type 1 TsaE [Bacteroidales bacterium]MBN2749386.1 tRNA (adenosine(37)-N6)-threonylcarbamoyltransferase complex ATPase subunit type 1 TsaE [Bacteroidales bacterium]
MIITQITSLNSISTAANDVIKAIGTKNVVCFYGGMGAGKTTLIKAICKNMGVTDNVASPTFALVNEYRDASSRIIFHFDFYRINKLEEVYDFGYEEYFYSDNALCLIEWPELVEDILPEDSIIKLHISVNPDGTRTVTGS